MIKIVKRKHWSEFSTPRKPTPPIEPKEYLDISEEIGNGCENLALVDIKIPEGFSYKDLYFSTNYESYDVYASVSTKVINKDYEKQFIKYNQDLVKHEQDLIDYDQELKEYNLWKKQFAAEKLEKQIKNAKAFLKKHDK